MVNLAYICVGLLFFLICITYRIKIRFIRWLLILLPPFLLLFLIRVPMDEYAILLFWLPSVAAFLGSGLSIFVHLLILAGNKLAKKPFNKPFLIRFIRPALTIACFIIAVFFAKRAIKAADDRGIEIAKEIHQTCNRDGSCPQKMENWEWDTSGYYLTWHGRYGARYPILYRVPDIDPNSFKIEVRHNFGDRLYIYGGVGKKLQKQYHDCELVDVE